MDSGRILICYGTKRERREDSIVADPNGSAAEREVAELFGRAVSERTYFHGEQLAENYVGADGLEVTETVLAPDLWDLLMEQAEQRLVDFGVAWARMWWILPQRRVALLNTLWWSRTLSPDAELALTLLLYGGWYLDEVIQLQWNMIRGRTAKVGVTRIALPDRALVLLRARKEQATARRDGFVVLPAVTERVRAQQELEAAWDSLRKSAARSERQPVAAYPDWNRLLAALGERPAKGPAVPGKGSAAGPGQQKDGDDQA